MVDGGAPGGSAVRVEGAAPDRGRPRRGLVVVGVALVLVAVAGWVVWDLRPGRRTGPDPSVASSDSCGGGPPTAVLAFGAAGGEPRWSALTGDAYGMQLADGTVGVHGGGTLRALDAADGHARWCRTNEPDGMVLGMVAAGDTFVTSRGGGGVVGYRAADGEVRWERQVGGGDRLWADGEDAVLTMDGPATPRPGGEPAPAQTTVGLTGATGAERWSYPSNAGLYVDSPIALLRSPDLGLTYVHDGISVTAVGDGGVRWSSPLFRPIGLVDGLLVGGVAQELEGQLRRFDLQALDPATGVERWRRDVPGFDARLVGGAIVVLHPTDPADAPPIEGFSTANGDGPIAGRSPASRTIATAYDPIDGSPLWERELPFAARIDAAGDRAVVWVPAERGSGGDGRLLALDPADGTVAWRADLPNPGRTRRHHLGDDLTGAGFDERTGTLVVLLRAQEPRRD